MAKAQKRAAEIDEAKLGDEDYSGVAELIVDNKLLMGKVDEIFGKPPKNVRDFDGSYRTDFLGEDDEDDPLSHS
jgi:hypothetical protein